MSKEPYLFVHNFTSHRCVVMAHLIHLLSNAKMETKLMATDVTNSAESKEDLSARLVHLVEDYVEMVVWTMILNNVTTTTDEMVMDAHPHVSSNQDSRVPIHRDTLPVCASRPVVMETLSLNLTKPVMMEIR